MFSFLTQITLHNGSLFDRSVPMKSMIHFDRLSRKVALTENKLWEFS